MAYRIETPPLVAAGVALALRADTDFLPEGTVVQTLVTTMCTPEPLPPPPGETAGAGGGGGDGRGSLLNRGLN